MILSSIGRARRSTIARAIRDFFVTCRVVVFGELEFKEGDNAMSGNTILAETLPP
jgi:hypothetical protein